jgi:hypothetical protein
MRTTMVYLHNHVAGFLLKDLQTRFITLIEERTRRLAGPD